MFRRQLDDIAKLKKEHRSFFYFSSVVLALYALQMLIRTEITPLGYFSLYSNTMKEQESYHQIMPYDTSKKQILNIYNAPGTGFLMMEILPTRYDILIHSDHCNQMNHKLRRIGLGDDNCCDCEHLKAFKLWFGKYAGIQNVDMSHAVIMDCAFKNGQLIGLKEVNDSVLDK